jgi:hypothetical protein
MQKSGMNRLLLNFHDIYNYIFVLTSNINTDSLHRKYPGSLQLRVITDFILILYGLLLIQLESVGENSKIPLWR